MKLHAALAARVLSLMLCMAAGLSAGVVYSNGGPINDLNYGGLSIWGSHWSADDFLLGSNTTITSVGFYFTDGVGITGWDDSVTYQFRADSGGAPGAILASGFGQNVGAGDSGIPWCCGGNAWRVVFTLQTPFNAVGGTEYWLELTGTYGNMTQAYWVVTNYPNTSAYRARTDLFSDNVTELAFDLSGTPQQSGVPEPATLTLCGAALIGLTAMRRRLRAGQRRAL